VARPEQEQRRWRALFRTSPVVVCVFVVMLFVAPRLTIMSLVLLPVSAWMLVWNIYFMFGEARRH
jgi:hypothetical protein